MTRLVVTGTDTDVGKTVFAAALAGACGPSGDAPRNAPAPGVNSLPPNANAANAAGAPAANANAGGQSAGTSEGERLARAKTLFAANCSDCHLESGKGSPDQKKNDIELFFAIDLSISSS